MTALGSLRALRSLPSLVTVRALTRAAERSLLWSAPLGFFTATAALGLARYASHSRLWALGAMVPVLAPLAVGWWRAQTHPLPLCAEVDTALRADASVMTAAELTLHPRPEVDATVRARITRDAEIALQQRSFRDVAVRPRRRALMALGCCLALLTAGFVTPVARAHPPRPPVARVTDRTTADAAREAAESLRAAAEADPDRTQALTQLAERAERLAHDLQTQMPRDEALLRTSDLERDTDNALAWARDQQHQRAVDAALQQMRDPDAQAMRDALAEGDMARLDAAARRLADRREAASQQAALDALQRAAQAARQAGSPDLARALDDEADLLRRRTTASRLAQAVAQALGDTPASRRIADHLSREGQDGATSRALDEVMRELDRTLTDDERRRLAQALAEMSRNADATSRADLDRASRAATQAEMREAMQRLVRALRNGSLDRTRAGHGQRGGQAAQAALGNLRVQLQTGRRPGAGGGSGGGRGGEHDEGHEATTGSTQTVRRDGFVAPVEPRRDPGMPGVPVETVTVNTTGARAGVADQVGLRAAAPGAMQGVERMPVPAPWRDQVRVYFQP